MNFRWTLWRKNYNLKATRIMLEIIIVTQTFLTPTKSKMTESLKLCTLWNMWKHKASHGDMLLWSQCSKQANSLEEQTGSTGRTSATDWTKQCKWVCHDCSPSFELKMPRVRSRIACDRLKTTKLITLSPILEVVWQRPPEISMDNFMLIMTNDIAITATTQTARTP